MNNLTSARCHECGDLIKHAELDENGRATCSKCAEPLKIITGTGAPNHWDDDESGASGSWDMIVKAYEGGT